MGSANHPLSITDQLGLTDSRLAQVDHTANIADLLALTDSVRYDRSALLSDLLSVTDIASLEHASSLTLADALTLSDLVVAVGGHIVTLADAMTIIDLLVSEIHIPEIGILPPLFISIAENGHLSVTASAVRPNVRVSQQTGPITSVQPRGKVVTTV